MTSVISNIATELVTQLNSAFAGKPITAVLQFSSAPRPVPLTQTRLAVGLQDAQVLPCALSDFAGLDENSNSICCRTMEITAAIKIYCPPKKETAECQRIFGMICDNLLFTKSKYDVMRIWCGHVQFEKDLGALVLPCYAKLRLTVNHHSQEQSISDFKIRRVNE